MKRGDAFPSQYLAKEDVEVAIVATIADVEFESIQGDKGTDDKPVISFAEQNIKRMILNQTNWTTIEVAYGDETDLWRGKKVELYVDPTVMFAGKRVGGVRVRVPDVTTIPMLSWKEALVLAKEAGMSEDGLKAALKAHSRTGYSAKKDSALVQTIIATAKGEADVPHAEFDGEDDSIPF